MTYDEWVITVREHVMRTVLTHAPETRNPGELTEVLMCEFFLAEIFRPPLVEESPAYSPEGTTAGQVIETKGVTGNEGGHGNS